MTWLVVLDRDGVINEDRPDYVKSIAEFKLIDRAANAIRRMNGMGWKVAVATNQSCIGKGILAESELQAIHNHMIESLARDGARIDKIYFAPDHPDRPTNRRKPGSGMIDEALAHFNIQPQKTIMIGDALRDLQAAKGAAQGAGCHRCLIKTGRGMETWMQGIPDSIRPVIIADHLDHAVDQVMSLES